MNIVSKFNVDYEVERNNYSIPDYSRKKIKDEFINFSEL